MARYISLLITLSFHIPLHQPLARRVRAQNLPGLEKSGSPTLSSHCVRCDRRQQPRDCLHPYDYVVETLPSSASTSRAIARHEMFTIVYEHGLASLGESRSSMHSHTSLKCLRKMSTIGTYIIHERNCDAWVLALVQAQIGESRISTKTMP